MAMSNSIIEATRPDFEREMVLIAEKHEYKFMNHLLKRVEGADIYTTTWVDSAWIGWKAALLKYKIDCI
jgi:hypothetical protein